MEDAEAEYVAEMMKRLRAERFTGNIQINLRCGGITNINKSESIQVVLVTNK